MIQYNLAWMLGGITLIAILLGQVTIDTQSAYGTSIIVLSLFAAIFVRVQLRRSHYHAVAESVIVSLLTGSILMAWGSYYFTFIKPSSGFLVGGGWGSVGAAAFFGGFAGLIFGIIPLLLYLVFAVLQFLNVDSPLQRGSSE